MLLEALENRVVPATFFVDAAYVGPENGSMAMPFNTIQEGVNASAIGGGDTVMVAAGTYAENVVIDRPLSLLGAQASIPGAARGPFFLVGPNGPKADPTVESIITAVTANPVNPNPNAEDLVRVLASGVTIDGFTFDGNNPALGSASVTLNGVELHARRGITNVDATNAIVGVDNLLVQNNVMQNFASRAISLADDASAATGNLITQNYIRNFREQGIILFLNAYADVTDNTVILPFTANGTTGIHQQNFYATGTMTWSGNIVQVGKNGIGIHANLSFNNSGVLNITNNVVDAETLVNDTESGLTWGINVWSMLNGPTVNISDNLIGFGGGGTLSRGVNVWSTPGGTVTLNGDQIQNSAVGFNIDAVDPYFGGAAGDSSVSLTDVNITGGTIGVRVRSAMSTVSVSGSTVPTSNVLAKITGGTIAGATTGILVQDTVADAFKASLQFCGGTTITGGTDGIVIRGAGSELVGNTFLDTVLQGQSGFYIALYDLFADNQVLDALGVTFDSYNPATDPLDICRILELDDKIRDERDDPTVGLVNYTNIALPFLPVGPTQTVVIYDMTLNLAIIIGRQSADVIYAINSSPTSLMVMVNGTTTNLTVNAATRIVVCGRGGNDFITVTGTARDTELHGGAGNDVIVGGAGRDVIYGEDGDDNIQGSAGNDVLVGGAGFDRLSGGAGLDIEVGGSFKTNPSNAGLLGQPYYNFEALAALCDDWAADGMVSTMLANAVAADIVDTVLDRFTGGTEADWFIGNTFDQITDLQGIDKDQRTLP